MRSGPILDYSSPRPRGKLRLPSQSRIEMLPDPDGVIVHEWLAAKGQAIFAIALAGASLLLMPTVFVISEKRDFQRPLAGDIGFLLFLGVVIAVVFIAGLIVMAMVINNTWRHTFVEARRDSLILRFRSPFGSERFEWNVSEVEDIRLETTTKPNDRNHLGEVEIHLAARPMVKLFTDHVFNELLPIEAALRKAIGLNR
jgi:hypothetical protein